MRGHAIVNLRMGQRRLFYGWIVVGASATIICIGMGALFSLGVFLKPMADTMGWSRGAISSVALLNWIAMGLGSFFWGALSDRIGTRGVAVAGGLLLGLGLVLSSRVQSLWQLYVTFGFMVGFAVGAFYAPLTSTATKWFTARRGLAVALVSAGIGVGHSDDRAAGPCADQLGGLAHGTDGLGDLAWLVVIPVALLIREPADVGAAALGGAAPRGRHSVLTGRGAGDAAVLDDRAHALRVLRRALRADLPHGDARHRPGAGPMAAATALGVSGFSSIIGRIGGGLLADRVGAKPTLVAGLACRPR